MIRKVIIFTLPVLLLSAITFFLIKNKNNVDFSPYNAIPSDAGMIIEIKKFHSFSRNLTRDNDFWKELTKIESISNLQSAINYIDSLGKSYLKLNELLKHEPFIISVHSVGKDLYDILYYVNINTIATKKTINDIIHQITKRNLKTKTYSGEDIYYVPVRTFDNKQRTLSYCVINNVFICSYSTILLENAIRQAKLHDSMLSDSYFSKVKQTAGNYSDANIYLNQKNFPRFITPLLNSKHHHIKESVSFANWTELDMDIKKTGVLLTGVTVSSDSSNNYLNIFRNQEPVKPEIETIIPSYITSFLVVGLNDYSKFSTDYKQFLELSGKLNKYYNTVSSIKRNYGVNLEKLSKDIFDNEVGILFEENENNDKIVVVKTKSKSIAREKFLEIIKNDARKNRKKSSDYISKHKIDDDYTFNIYKTPITNYPELAFGDLFKDIACTHFTFVNNYMVFASNTRLLSEMVRYNILSKTFSNETQYREFSKYLASQSNFYFYLDNKKAKNIIQNFLSLALYNVIDENYETIRKVSALSFQFSVENDMFYNNVFLNYSPHLKNKPKTNWESKLDTTASFKPRLVTNHYTNEKEIFIQDQKNNIYLINKSGRILWKLRIPEKIVSDIVQVDYYRNNKLQLLFSTKNHIHLIDRNGNHVERYPIKLRSSSTNGINVYDYDKNKNYRIFVACENKKVYAYNLKGDILSGWNFNKTDSRVITPVQHFRVSGKDYIVFADAYKVYIVNRRGSTRVRLSKQFSKSRNNIFYLDNYNTSGKPRLVTTDKKGTVRFIFFDGKVVSTSINNYSEGHFFELKDIDGDRLSDFIFLDKKKLEVYKQNKQIIYKYSFSNELTHSPVCYKFGEKDIKIGIVNETLNQIFLFNKDGNIYKGFPLDGSTQFSIGKFSKSAGKFNLLVGNEDIFLYNYIIQ